MKLRKLFVALSALALSFGASVAAMTTLDKGNSESVNAADKSTGVYLPGAWHSNWAEDDTSKMYYQGSYQDSGTVYRYYIGFTTTAANQEFKVHDTEHNQWVNTLGGSSGNTLQYSGDNVKLKNNKYGLYVLTYCYKNGNEKWIDNCVSGSGWLTVTKKYSINGSDAGSAGSNQSLDFGAALSGITNPTAKTGYTFGGWYWEAACTTPVDGSAIADGFDSPTGQSTTVYAKMVAKSYTVTLNRNGGTGGSSSVSATYNSPMPSATKPSRTGYHFDGYWDGTGGTGNQYYNSSMGSVHNWETAGTGTLYAKWDQIRYIYYVSAATEYDTGDYIYSWSSSGSKQFGEFPGRHISEVGTNVTGVVEFEGSYKRIYKIEIWNDSFLFNNGTNEYQTENKTTTNGAAYWWGGAANPDPGNTDAGAALDLIFAEETARNAVTAGGGIQQYSICGIDSTTAGNLVTTYNNLTAEARRLVNTSTTKTYVGTTSVQDQISFEAIFAQLAKIGGNSNRSILVSSSIFGLLNSQNGNTSVVIIIFASLIAVAGVSGFFLLRKRKEQ